jgi:hypothetical protein
MPWILGRIDRENTYASADQQFTSYKYRPKKSVAFCHALFFYVILFWYSAAFQ